MIALQDDSEALRRSLRRGGTLVGWMLLLAVAVIGPAAAKPTIVAVTTSGNHVSWTQIRGGGPPRINAAIGLWADWYIPVYSTTTDTLNVDIAVHGRGGVAFNWQLRTWRGWNSDPMEVSLITSAGVRNYGSYGIGVPPQPADVPRLTISGVYPITVDLSAYKGQTVRLSISVIPTGPPPHDWTGPTQVLLTNLRTFGTAN